MPSPLIPTPGSELFDLVWFPSPTWLEDLATVAQPENWDDEGNGRQPILLSYVRYTARQVLAQAKWLEFTSPAGTRRSAFNTGLLSRDFEPIIAIFEENPQAGRQPWVHKEWALPSSARLRSLAGTELEQAVYFDDPGEAVFDPRIPVVRKVEHIVHDNVDRYPPMLRDNDYMRTGMLERAIAVAAAKAKANWRLAAPQYYWPGGATERGHLQLLLPLALLDPGVVDLALVLDRDPTFSSNPGVQGVSYRAYTVLPVEWAYRNARLITRPEAYWLDPNSRADAGSPEANDDGGGNWRSARGNNLCPACGASGGCLVAADNRRVLCRNAVSEGSFTTRSGITLWRHTATWSPAGGAS
jgi:hypothetical protein